MYSLTQTVQLLWLWLEDEQEMEEEEEDAPTPGLLPGAEPGSTHSLSCKQQQPWLFTAFLAPFPHVLLWLHC